MHRVLCLVLCRASAGPQSMSSLHSIQMAQARGEVAERRLVCREITSDTAAVLHYTYNRFNDLKSRRDR